MTKLPDPYGSPPGRSPRYALYVTHREDEDRVMAVTFAEPYAARKFLDALWRKDVVTWDDECTASSETGIVVSTRWWPGRLRECVDHEYTLAEAAWPLDGYVRDWARSFRHGLREAPESVEQTKAATAAKSAPSRPPAGYVSLADVATSLGVDARDARRALRSFTSAPAYGWWFDPASLADIKRKIQEAIK